MKSSFKALMAAASLLPSLGSWRVEPTDVRPEQEVRKTEYSEKNFTDANFGDEFNDVDIECKDGDIKISAVSSFPSSLFTGFDLAGVSEEDGYVNIDYVVRYVENEDSVFLDASVEEENGEKLFDTLPGIATYNEAGEPDVLFSCDGEMIWLSDISEEDYTDNAGWLSNLFKKIIDGVSKKLSDLVKAFKSLIKPAVKICMYLTYKLIGEENAAKWGSAILMMSKDDYGVYHANFDCWQQYFGYTDLYDTVFDAATSMRSRKFPFDYDGDGLNDRILWAWKGDYLNLGAGVELGVYTKWKYSDIIWRVDKSLAMVMTLKLELKVGSYPSKDIINWAPKQKQWWITGFNPAFKDVNRDQLTAYYSVTFNSKPEYDSFFDDNPTWKPNIATDEKYDLCFHF